MSGGEASESPHHSGVHGKADQVRAAKLLRSAARELADIGVAVQEASVHVTAALTDGAVLGSLLRAPAGDTGRIARCSAR
ncbi:hypothetical protein ACFQX6_02575 [Streptosporangium lutulentum]